MASQSDNSSKDNYSQRESNPKSYATTALPQLSLPSHTQNDQNVVSNYQIGNTRPMCMLKIRPLFVHESLACKKSRIQVLDRESLIFSTTDGTNAKEDLMNLTRDKLFRTDRMIPAEQPNVTLSNLEFDSIIDKLLGGISHAMLATGDKGTGKTHAMFGTIGDPGLILYFAQKLFQRKSTSQTNINIQLSMMKYQEDFYDLLCPTGEPLMFKQTRHGIVMPGVSNMHIDSLREFFIFLRLGLKQMTGRDLHSESQLEVGVPPERGHLIIRFKIVHQGFDKHTVTKQNEGGAIIQEDRLEQKIYESEMNFIDCDHYELNEKMENKGIQQSLLILENTIQYVYEINKGIRTPHTHIPYEESKFTTFYKSYLFGTNQLFLLGTLSPFRDHVEMSMKTARITQWAFNSTNSVAPKFTIGKQAFQKISQKEIGFVQKIFAQTNLLGEDIKLHLSNSYLRQEEKNAYLDTVYSMILKQKYLLTRNLKLINHYLGFRDDVIKLILNIQTDVKQNFIILFDEKLIKMKRECLRTEFEAVKYCIKSEEIKELYLVKSLPLPGEVLLKDIRAMRSAIAKRVREINFYFGALREVKQKLIELTQQQEDEMKISLKATHQVAMIELSTGLIDYLRWSQDNAIRSFEALQPGRMDSWMEEVSQKIFSFLEHLLKHIDPKSLQNFSKMKQFKKIPTDMALKSIKSAVLSSSSDFNLVHPHQLSSQYSGTYGQRESSIFSRDFSFLNHKQLGQKEVISSSEQIQEPPNSVQDAFKNFLILKSNDKIAIEKKKKCQQVGLDKIQIPHLNRENKQISSNNEDKQREIVLYQTRQQNLDKLNHLSDRKFEKTKKLSEILPLKNQGSLMEENHKILRNNETKLKFSSLINLNQSQIQEDIQDITNDNQNNNQKQQYQDIITANHSPPLLKHISSFNYHNQDKRGTLEGFDTYQENFSENSNSLYQLEEEEEEEYLNSNKDRVKYSMADLQRIDFELKEKKDQFKNTHRQLLREAELTYKRQRNKTEPCGEDKQQSIQKSRMTQQTNNNTQIKESLGYSRVLHTEGSQTTKDGQVSFRKQRSSWQEKQTSSQQELRILKAKADTLTKKAYFEEQLLIEGMSNNVNSFQKSLGLLNQIASTNRNNNLEQPNKPKSLVSTSIQITSPQMKLKHRPLKKASISLEQLSTVVNPKNISSVFSLGMLSMKGDNHGRGIGHPKEQPIILGGIQADSLRINSLALINSKQKQIGFNGEVSLQQQSNGQQLTQVEKSANQSIEEQKKLKAFNLINQLKHHTQSLQGDIKQLIQSCSKF